MEQNKLNEHNANKMYLLFATFGWESFWLFNTQRRIPPWAGVSWKSVPWDSVPILGRTCQEIMFSQNSLPLIRQTCYKLLVTAPSFKSPSLSPCYSFPNRGKNLRQQSWRIARGPWGSFLLHSERWPSWWFFLVSKAPSFGSICFRP